MKRFLIVGLCLLCIFSMPLQTQAQEQLMSVWATGYNAEEGFDPSTRTSNGTVPNWGTVAVDPNVIPYGSIIFSKKYAAMCNRYGIALDCGGAIKGYRVDWWTETNQQSFSLTGWEEITILRWGWHQWIVDPKLWGL